MGFIGLKGIPVSANAKALFSHDRIEKIISQELGQGGHLKEWEVRVRKLDGADGLEELIKMKQWTDRIATASVEFSSGMVYQFDGDRLQAIHLCK